MMILIFAVLILFSPLAHAEDVDLGKIQLTKNQTNALTSLNSDVVKGFTVKGDNVTVTATRNLSDSEKSDLVSKLKALPDNAPSDPDNMSVNPFYKTNPKSAEDYIENNVKNAADQKTVLKVLARAVAYLSKDKQ